MSMTETSADPSSPSDRRRAADGGIPRSPRTGRGRPHPAEAQHLRSGRGERLGKVHPLRHAAGATPAAFRTGQALRRAAQDGAPAQPGQLCAQHEQIDTTFPVTVEQVVMMGRYGHMGLTRRARPADRTAVAQALEQVGLQEFRRRAIGELSGGQRKRVFVARAIAQQAPLMLLDEPSPESTAPLRSSSPGCCTSCATAGPPCWSPPITWRGVGELADEVVLLHRRVLAAGLPEDVLTEEQLGRAFGAVLSQPLSPQIPTPRPVVPGQEGDSRWSS